MFRSTLLGSVLAVCLAPLSMGLNSFMSYQPAEPEQSAEESRLAESITRLGNTLVSFEARQTGSETQLTEQLKALASAVASTQAASEDQISKLTESIAEVRQVALQAPDTGAFEQLLEDYSNNFEKRMSTAVRTLVKAEIDEALPAKGVGTLDVDGGPEADDGRPEDFADAARRIVALEKEVAALKARSAVSASYPAASGSVSNGSSGGTGVTYNQPTYTYSQPAYSYQTVSPPISRPAQRRGWFGSSRCYTVGGVTYCN